MTKTCIICPIGCELTINKTKNGWDITGNKCKRGEKYAIEEMTNPTRIVTSTIKINGACLPVIPVKTSNPIPKDKIHAVMKIIATAKVNAPAHVGDIIIENILGLNSNLVVTKNMKKN